jgi:hypothetical protein
MPSTLDPADLIENAGRAWIVDAGIVSVIGLAAVVLSLLVTAWQTRELVQQTRISNSVNIAAACVSSGTLISSAHSALLEDPSLRAYIYDGKPCSVDDPNRSKVVTVAELLGDATEYGLIMGEHLDQAKKWRAYPISLLATSPVFYEVVADRPGWWPALEKLLKECPPRPDAKADAVPEPA